MEENDLRKHVRVPPDPAAPVRVDIMGNGFLEVRHARDISIGGVSVFVRHGFAASDIDTEVELIITLGRARPFKTRGIIRHRSSGGDTPFFGLQFSGLTPEHQALIEDYVQRQLERLRKR